MSDETNFFFNCSVNSQYWPPENYGISMSDHFKVQKSLSSVPLQHRKLSIPTFKEDNGAALTFNSKHYNGMLTTLFVSELTRCGYPLVSTGWIHSTHNNSLFPRQILFRSGDI